MNRKDLENLARRTAHAQLPTLTSFAASELIKSEPVQRWLDKREREHPRGLVARWRRRFGRMFGRNEGLSPTQRAELEDVVRKAMERRGR